MKNLLSLIKVLAENQIALWVEEDGSSVSGWALKYKAPKGALSPDLKESIIGLKSELIDRTLDVRDCTLHDDAVGATFSTSTLPFCITIPPNPSKQSPMLKQK